MMIEKGMISMTNRLNEIRKTLFTRREVSVKELSERFHVSAVIIRKDLDKLESEGIASRVYGGAVLSDRALPTSLDHMEDPVKARLAETACSLIHDGDNIFLGSGKTCCYLAMLLERFHNLSVVTNNISALNDLLHTDARVYLLGGEVTSTDASTMFSSPEDPNTFLDNIYVSKAFTSVSGIDLKAGLTVDSIVSTHIYRHLPAIARDWYLIADSAKFDKIAIYPVANFNAVHYLITDKLPEKYQETIQDNQVKVYLSGK